MSNNQFRFDTPELRADIVQILSVAVDKRAPYVAAMVDAIIDAMVASMLSVRGPPQSDVVREERK